MFGFIELHLAQVLGLIEEDDCTPFILNSGAAAATVDIELYNRILIALERVHNAGGYPGGTRPKDVASDINGMKVILHMFYYDDDVIDGLTGSEVKRSTLYHNIMNMGRGSSRFDVARFEEAIIHAFNNPAPPQEEAVDIIDELVSEVVDDPVVQIIEPAPLMKTPEELFLEERQTVRRNIVTAVSRIFSTYKICGESGDLINCFYIIGGDSYISDGNIIEFATNMKKDVYVLNNQNYDTIIRKLNSSCSAKELEKHCIIIVNNYNTYQFATVPSSSNKSLCFGRDVDKLSVVVGKDINKSISDIRNNITITDEERNKRIDELIKSKQNSSYSKFDMIYRDAVTNVVWAVRERNIVYFMPMMNYNNTDLFEIMMKELARRYGGTLAKDELRRIDFEYQRQVAEANRKSYIDFSINNSNSIITELKKSYEDAYKKYTQLWDQLLETGKMMKKYQDQIEMFDEESHKRKETERAQKTYDDTLALEKVSAIYVKGESIHVYTKNIYAQDDRTKRYHDIGTFHITIGMESNKYDIANTIKIKNIKHQIQGLQPAMEAPHVFPQGYMCHGNAEAGLATAYIKRDLYQLVLQVILFLSYANTDDAAGKYVNCWPEVSKEEATRIESDDIVEVKQEIDEAEKKFDEGLDAFLPVRNN